MMTIKETLFLDLLQKKEEASIARAAITVGTKILYPPIVLSSGQSPSKSQVLILSLLSGLLIPLIYALIREILNRKVISKKQLQRLTSVPVIAELEQTEKVVEEPFVIAKNSRSMFGEQMRSLRTNLEFFKSLNKPTNYLLITSSVSGEGKTFISINLAKTYSLQGKKVALLEFDLRRPKIAKEFNLPSDRVGLSTFLIGKCEIADIIHNVADDTDVKFDLFTSGPIPPNPQELMSSAEMVKLKEYLDAHYDIIVIDSPPFGMVADAQILGKWADATLIITRYYQTVFEQIEEINDWKERAVFPSMSIILNGVMNTGYFGNRYGYYYYRRKYGYGYYTYGYYGGKGSKGKKKGVY
jgi:Mrp family chromosome partitioning ATPase